MGFSGGLDSTVLLHALQRRQGAAFAPQRAGRGLRPAAAKDARRDIQGRLCALHANHALHGDADAWEQHCRDACAHLGVELQSATLSIREDGSGLEAAARDARYRWFAEILEPSDLLLLAHHQDDQVETLLLRLLRGAGPDGLGAMPARRGLGAGRLLRPLLSLPREALREYAHRHSLGWIEDPGNRDLHFDRNYLRSEVIPRLADRWPGYRKTLTRAAVQMRELIDVVPDRELPTLFSVTGDPGFRLEDLPADELGASRALRGWLRAAGLPMPGAARLKEFLRQLREGRGARLATSVWVLERYRDAVYAYAAQRPATPRLSGPALGEQPRWAGPGRLSLAAALGEEGLRGCVLRPRSGGERLRCADGHHRGLKAVFQHHGVPPWWRDRVPLLLRRSGSDEELLLAGPFARSPRAGELGLEMHWQPPVLCPPPGAQGREGTQGGAGEGARDGARERPRKDRERTAGSAAKGAVDGGSR